MQIMCPLIRRMCAYIICGGIYIVGDIKMENVCTVEKQRESNSIKNCSSNQ